MTVQEGGRLELRPPVESSDLDEKVLPLHRWGTPVQLESIIKSERCIRQKYYIMYSPCWKDLKGQCHDIFDLRFFLWISFPQAPDYPNRVVSNFFENSRRYW